jgi:hypothetical protein
MLSPTFIIYVSSELNARSKYLIFIDSYQIYLYNIIRSILFEYHCIHNNIFQNKYKYRYILSNISMFYLHLN